MSVYRQQWQIDSFNRMGHGVGFVRLPLVGLAQIKAIDGQAVLILHSGRGVITREWFSFCKFTRRREGSHERVAN